MGFTVKMLLGVLWGLAQIGSFVLDRVHSLLCLANSILSTQVLGTAFPHVSVDSVRVWFHGRLRGFLCS